MGELSRVPGGREPGESVADKVCGVVLLPRTKEGCLLDLPGLLESGRRGAGAYRYVRGRSRIVK